MHFKNGRPAKNGDKVVFMPVFGAPVIGILYDALPGNNHCNGRIAPIAPNDPGANLSECLHLDDVRTALPEQVPIAKMTTLDGVEIVEGMPLYRRIGDGVTSCGTVTATVHGPKPKVRFAGGELDYTTDAFLSSRFPADDEGQDDRDDAGSMAGALSK